jgi:glutaredoxin
MRRAFRHIALTSAMCALATLAPLARAPNARASGSPRVSSTSAGVTMYSASWCSACKALAQGLRDRDVPFDAIDVEQNPRAYEVARRATGESVIPITSVARSAGVQWVVGADVAAVERAYRGE